MYSLELVKVINAAKSFKLKDKFEFIEINDESIDDIASGSIPDEVEVWAVIKLFYDGEIPDSYRTLNLIIGDWVEEHEPELVPVINKHLKYHFEKKYPEVDVSDIDDEKSTIWHEQLDYMPRIDDDQKSIIIEIELVMQAEPPDREDADQEVD